MGVGGDSETANVKVTYGKPSKRVGSMNISVFSIAVDMDFVHRRINIDEKQMKLVIWDTVSKFCKTCTNWLCVCVCQEVVTTKHFTIW